MLATTRPYFTSTYVVVMRADAKHQFTSFDDAWLGQAKIGLQLVGAEGASTPPAASLAKRGDTGHISFFPMWAAPGVDSPQGRIVDAVADGTIDAAFVWGPFGGYFAKPHGAALRLVPVTADAKLPEQSFTFAMAMGARKDDMQLRDRLQSAIDRHTAEISAILLAYGVPVVTENTGGERAASPPLTH
jgi:mxaJ protein